VLDKLTPNQRLLVAVILSVVFFTAYTAIFPPVEPEAAQDAPQNKPITQNIGTSTELTKTNTTVSPTAANIAGHEISQEERSIANDLNTLVTVTNDDFVLKMDTLGRISSKELLQEKFNSKEDSHAQMISPLGTKPLYVRFLDLNLNDESVKTPYTANVSTLNLCSSCIS